MYRIRKFSFHAKSEEIKTSVLQLAIRHLSSMGATAAGEVINDDGDRVCYRNPYSYDLVFTIRGQEILINELIRLEEACPEEP